MNHSVLKKAIPAALAAVGTIHAQEKPLQGNVTLTTGYYDSYSRGDGNQNLTFVPTDARFDLAGYILSPGLLSFTAQPEVSSGPQAGDVGFQGGNGVTLHVTALRNRRFPVTLRYSNVRRDAAYFGSLSQLSAFSVLERTHDLGVTWEVSPKGLPSSTLDWGVQSTTSKSDLPQAPDYSSHLSHVNLDSRYEKSGWLLNGSAHYREVQSDLVAPALTLGATSLRQNVAQYQAAAQHDLFRDSSIDLSAGLESNSTTLLALPVQFNTRFANGSLRLFQRRRWKGSIRAGYSSNVASEYLSQIVTGLTTTGPGAIVPTQDLLTPFEQRAANLTFNAYTSVDLGHGFSLYSSADRSSIASSNQISPLTSSIFTISTGATYAAAIAWGRLSGQYAVDFGEGSLTGPTGAVWGQNYSLTLEQGTPDRIQFDLNVHGMIQTVDISQPIHLDSYAADAGFSRRVTGSFSLRLGGGYQQGMSQSGPNQFHSNGFTARGEIFLPKLQVNAAINDTLGSAVSIYNSLLLGLPTAGLIASGTLVTLPSDFRSVSFSVLATPVRKLQIMGTYHRSLQNLAGEVNNYFELYDARLVYHFRRLQMEAGYLRSNQIYLSYPNSLHGRIYFRVSRNVKVL